MAFTYGSRGMVLVGFRERTDRAAELAEEKRWAARKEHLFAAMGGSAADVYDFENLHHFSVLKGEVRRYDAAVKQAAAANTTAAAEGSPS